MPRRLLVLTSARLALGVVAPGLVEAVVARRQDPEVLDVVLDRGPPGRVEEEEHGRVFEVEALDLVVQLLSSGRVGLDLGFADQSVDLLVLIEGPDRVGAAVAEDG